MAMEEILKSHPFLREYTHPVKKAERAIIGREHEMRSILAAFQRPELCNVILLGEAGAGKGHPNYEVLPTPKGYTQVGDIQVGDYVYDEHGQPVKVIGVYPQGKKHLYEAVFSDGTHVPCNDEHIWSVRSRKSHYKDGAYQNMTLRELMDAGIHRKQARDDGSVVNNWYIPVNKPLHRQEAQLPLDPYVLGVLIGDGCLTDTVRTLEISSNDESVIAEVAKRIGATGYKQRVGCYSWIFLCDAEKYGHKWYQQTDLAKLSDDLSCVFGQYSRNRAIPTIYKFGSIAQRRLLLQGLMDTDGCITGEDRLNASFATKSAQLALDVKELATSLGMRTSITVTERVDKGMEYEVHFRIDPSKRRDLFLKAQSKLAAFDKGMASRIRKFNRHYDDMALVDVIDTETEVEMTCIYVDSPTHLYQVGRDHIVTHNTALVQGTMLQDTKRLYLEVDLSKMIADLTDNNQMADRLKSLFDEVSECVRESGKEIVLFMDEFHQIVQLSAAAVEALKPLLADSGTRGIRIIAATTYEEFRKYISPNQPLVERLQRISLQQPDEALTVNILKGMAKRYGVANQFCNDNVFKLIYEYTNRYVPASSQPRKSILILDSMVGWHRLTNRKMDAKLLADVIYETTGTNVAFRVDATSIKKELDRHVLAQKFATTAIEQRLQICVADLNDKSKPMSTMLFTGSTGVGKGHPVGTLIPTLEDNSKLGYTKVEDIKPGDHVFAPDGSPVKVLGVFPRGEMKVYHVKFSDGRSVVVDKDHLWGVYLYKHDRDDDNLMVISTHRIAKMLSKATSRETRKLRFSVPMNQPVQWLERELPADPYVLGAFIADGCLTKSVSPLVISGDDEYIVKKCAARINAAGYERCSNTHNHANGTASVNYSWKFLTGEMYRGKKKLVQKADVLGMIPEVYNRRSTERRIPELYLRASVKQRWELVQGLFDTDGTISAKDGGRFNVLYSTSCKGLASDVRELLLSLGVLSTVTQNHRDNGTGSRSIKYTVHVRTAHNDKERFFSLPRKQKIARRAAVELSKKTYDTDFVDIVSVEPLPDKVKTVCLYVDHPDHLYQCDDFIVTHNTEMTKQLARILFDDDRNLIRFDMTEYANDDSLERFRSQLTSRVWEHPYSIVLLDEIEKASATVTRLLLQVLDDGRLSDQNGRETPFINSYIILTTNAGSEIYKTIAQYNADDEGSGKIMKKYDALIRRSLSSTTGTNQFPPELLGRIDSIIPFQPLSRETQKAIVKMKLQKLKKEIMAKHGAVLKVSTKVIDYLVEDNLSTDSDSGGARRVMSKLESELTTAVARYINKHPDISTVQVDVEGQMAFENKDQLESEAYIKVGGR